MKLAADVIIVGAGVTGCAMAAALADGERRILVLEARPGHAPHKHRFAGELIHPTGAQVLDELGFTPALRAAGGVEVDGFAVVREAERADQPTLLPYREIPRARPTGFAMEHQALCEAMRQVTMGRPGVTMRFGQKVEEVLRAPSGRACGVRTAEGEFHARLVLGCDGRHSKVRPLLNLPERARLVSFTVAVHMPGAARLLPRPGYGHIFLGAWGPMLVYPTSRDDARGCFDVPRDLSGGPRGAAELLRETYAPHLPEALRRVLIESLDRELPQIAANEAIRTESAVAAGAAIVGDAGGCSHPLTAGGMTVCFTDARRLGRLLAPLGDLADEGRVDAALRRYEVERYRFVRAREILADALYEVFRAAEPGTAAIRQGIFRYWERSERARARSMSLLSGAESRLPVFLREYLTVVANAGAAALLGQVPIPAPGAMPPAPPSDRPRARGDAPRPSAGAAGMRQRTQALFGLGKKSWEKLHLVVRDVRQEATR